MNIKNIKKNRNLILCDPRYIRPCINSKNFWDAPEWHTFKNNCISLTVFFFVVGRLPCKAEEGVNSDSAAVVQGAVPHLTAVRAREASRARAHGERAAAGPARAARQPAQAARRAARARPRRLVSTNQQFFIINTAAYYSFTIIHTYIINLKVTLLQAFTGRPQV